jgi:hypothetical protein
VSGDRDIKKAGRLPEVTLALVEIPKARDARGGNHERSTAVSGKIRAASVL